LAVERNLATRLGVGIGVKHVEEGSVPPAQFD
jgi:hypothetical protein